MVGFYKSIGWQNSCFNGQIVKFGKSQILGVADDWGQVKECEMERSGPNSSHPKNATFNPHYFAVFFTKNVKMKINRPKTFI